MASLNGFVKTLSTVLVKGAAIASFVAGALTAANGDLPHLQSAVLSIAGTAVFLFERYWADIKKAL